jgi:hypothetical protein
MFKSIKIKAFAQWEPIIAAWAALCLLVPIALEHTKRVPVLVNEKSPEMMLVDESKHVTKQNLPEENKNEKKLAAIAMITGKEIERVMAGSNLKHYSVDYRNGSLIMHFPKNYFSVYDAELPVDMAQELVTGFSLYVSAVAKNKKIKNHLKEIKIIGFSSPLSEFREIDGKKLYNKELATKRARSVFQRLFNVTYHTYEFQDYALVRSTINGDGLQIMANGKSMKEFCQINSCNALNYIMFKPELMADNIAEEDVQ